MPNEKEPFTFALTNTTNTKTVTTTEFPAKIQFHNTESLIAKPSLTTTTRTTDSSMNKPKNSPQTNSINCDFWINAQTGDQNNATQFTFSLTKTTPTASEAKTPKASSNIFTYPTSSCSAVATTTTTSAMFDNYNSYSPFPFVSNTFLPPPTTSNLVGGCDPSVVAPNQFSFALTSTDSDKSNKSNNNHLNALNPFSIDATLQQPKAAAKPYSGNFYPMDNSNNATSNQAAQKRPDKVNRATVKTGDPIKEKQTPLNGKNADERIETNKYQVNWMAKSGNGTQSQQVNPQIEFKSNNTMNMPPIEFTVNTHNLPYIAPPPSILPKNSNRFDFAQKSDIFFAHPPGEDNFLWNKPASNCQQLEPPLILPPPKPPPPPPPTSFGAPLALPLMNAACVASASSKGGEKKTTASAPQQAQYSNMGHNNNFFSVSHLVDPNSNNKRSPKTKQQPQNAQKWKNVQKPAEMEFRKGKQQQQQQQQIPTNSYETMSSCSKIYSAEALIGGHNSDPVRMNTVQVRPKKDLFCGQQNHHPPSNMLLEGYGTLNQGAAEHTDFYDYSMGLHLPAANTSDKNHQHQSNPYQDTNSFYFPPPKSNLLDLAANTTTDYVQPPIFPPPVPLAVAPSSDAIVHKQSSCKMQSVSQHKVFKKSPVKANVEQNVSLQDYYSAASNARMHHNNYTNYDSNYFAPPPPPSLSINASAMGQNTLAHPSAAAPPPPLSHPNHHPPPPHHHTLPSFNYADNFRSSQNYSMVDYNNSVTATVATAPIGATVHSNSLTNFNLSSICPEINGTNTASENKTRHQNVSNW